MQNLHSKPKNSQHRGKYLLYSCSTILLIWNPPNKTVCYWYVMKWVNPRPSNWRPDEQWYLPLRWVISDKAIALCWTDLVVHKKVKFDLKSNRWRLCSDDLLRSLELDFRVRIFILIAIVSRTLWGQIHQRRGWHRPQSWWSLRWKHLWHECHIFSGQQRCKAALLSDHAGRAGECRVEHSVLRVRKECSLLGRHSHVGIVLWGVCNRDAITTERASTVDRDFVSLFLFFICGRFWILSDEFF